MQATRSEAKCHSVRAGELDECVTQANFGQKEFRNNRSVGIIEQNTFAGLKWRFHQKLLYFEYFL